MTELHLSKARMAHIGRWQNRHGRRWLVSILIASIGIALMMNGAVAAPYRQIAVILVILALLPIALVRITYAPARRLWRQSTAITALLLLWAFVQSTPLPLGWLAHPVWDDLRDLGLSVQSTISVAPGATRAAIPALILPLTVFSAMILLCQEQRDALYAWKALTLIGLGLAALSIVLEVFFPETRFFSRFEVGRGAFNGIFVNRNTTAAFLGLVAFATAGWLMLPQPANNRDPGPRTGVAPFHARQILLSAILFLLLITLITTRSRAGVVLALLCLTLALAVVLALRPARHTGQSQIRRLGPKARLFLVIGAGLAVFIAFGEPVVSRMGFEAEDGRWCAFRSTLRMIAERPIVGQGFATFAEAFPQYRDPNCLGTEGVWTRAHNSHLEFLAGMGLVGGLVMVWALAITMRLLITGVKTRKSLQPIPIITLGALAFVLLHSVLDFPLQVPGVSLYFAALMGAGCAISILTRTARPPRSRRSTRATQG